MSVPYFQDDFYEPDPFASIEVGGEHRVLRWPPGGPVDACGARRPDGLDGGPCTCTRPQHPPWWLHLAATSGGKVLALWPEDEMFLPDADAAPRWVAGPQVDQEPPTGSVVEQVEGKPGRARWRREVRAAGGCWRQLNTPSECFTSWEWVLRNSGPAGVRLLFPTGGTPEGGTG